MSQNSATAATAVSRTADAIADLGAVYGLVEGEFRAVNQLIPEQLTSDVAMVEDIGSYIVESGGKRLRPLMVLLSSQALGYAGDQHVKLATIIEFLHTATLLHDDVVDHSGLRRGKPTANQKWGNAPSVLVGDFLYSSATIPPAQWIFLRPTCRNPTPTLRCSPPPSHRLNRNPVLLVLVSVRPCSAPWRTRDTANLPPFKRRPSPS